MRTDLKIALFSVAVLLVACGTEKKQTATLSDDLQKDLAVAAAPAPGLATAPTSFEKTQVVSAVERSRGTVPAKRLVATKKHTPRVRRAEAVSTPEATDVIADSATPGLEQRPAESVATEPEPVAAPSGPEVIAQQPSSDPGPLPDGETGVGRGGDGGSGDIGIGAGRSGGGLGGILGGIIGAVVIRGGMGGVDKCDPRTDGRRRGRARGRGGMGFPISGMPLPTGTRTFPHAR
jgi:hypothetical protein